MRQRSAGATASAAVWEWPSWAVETVTTAARCRSESATRRGCASSRSSRRLVSGGSMRSTGAASDSRPRMRLLACRLRLPLALRPIRVVALVVVAATDAIAVVLTMLTAFGHGLRAWCIPHHHAQCRRQVDMAAGAAVARRTLSEWNVSGARRRSASRARTTRAKRALMRKCGLKLRSARPRRHRRDRAARASRTRCELRARLGRSGCV